MPRELAGPERSDDVSRLNDYGLDPFEMVELSDKLRQMELPEPIGSEVQRYEPIDHEWGPELVPDGSGLADGRFEAFREPLKMREPSEGPGGEPERPDYSPYYMLMRRDLPPPPEGEE